MRCNKGKTLGSVCIMLVIIIVACIGTSRGVSAQDTVLTTVVPAQFQLKVEIEGKGTVTVGKEVLSDTATVLVDRHIETTVSIKPAQGYKIKSVRFNGDLLTEESRECSVNLPELTEDSILKVSFIKIKGAPSTGDESNVALISSLIMLILGTMLLFLMRKKMNKK